ncbi:MAG: hypothetical protein WDN08_08700 [Rhizomicrobium sp.]
MSSTDLPIKILDGTQVVRVRDTAVVKLPTCTVPENVELVQVEIPSHARTVNLDKWLEEQLGTRISTDRVLATDRAKR